MPTNHADKPENAAPEATEAGETPARKDRHWTDEIEVAGTELVERVKKLAAEGQVRRIRITEPDGDLVLEIPLTIGAVAGGALVLAAPLLAALGALAAFLTKVRIEVIRDGGGGTPPAA
ncbi:MAG: DUF4342 domain-containing protein [Rhodobacteraceae bacterium]|jgi:hypothetical protein|nr:DUF4342 domain-containing protein [Paracoccaceae bacterium]